jgi:MFS family permease
MATTDGTVRAHEKSILKVALTALAGTSIEWYDFFIYGTAAALVFPKVFFSGQLSPVVAQIAAFSTFAVGFLARPMGAVFFGHFGDRVGRKKALVTALMMMGVATMLIGLLPSYAAAGAAAPMMLVVLRFVQGLAIGGQWAGAVLLATENAPPHKRGFYGSFAQVGVPAGLILGNLVFLIVNASVSPESFIAWGWRVPFLMSILLIGIATYVQLHLEETAEFQELREAKQHHDEEVITATARQRGISIEQVKAEMAAERRPSPVIECLKTYPREITLAAGALLAIQVSFYIFTTFLVSYGTNPAGLALPRGTMLSAVLIGAVLMILVILLAAAYSDRHGRRGIFIAGAVLVGVWGFFLFPLIETKSYPLIVLAIAVGEMFFGVMYGPQAVFLAEMFSTRVRYSGASLGYQLGAILGGALTPIVATALVARFQSAFAVSVYIALACTLTVISALLLRETHKVDMTAEAVPGRAATTGRA